MSRINVIRDLIADGAAKLTWINSGAVPGALWSTIIDRNEVLVSSRSAQSSGNGHFYAVHQLPNSGNQWMVNRWFAVLNGNTYSNVQLLHVRDVQVD